jgi:hypothetical protein
MEMAPGAIPHPGRVPEQRLLSPEIGLRWRWRCRTFCGWMPIPLGFSRQREFIGRKAMLEGTQGAHTTWWRGQGMTRTTLWCGQPLALLRLCFRLRLRVGKNRRFGFRFVQFREYFLCKFSKIQKPQKTGTALWHLVNRLVPENA